MDLVLVVVGFLLCLLGIVGSFLPVLPGPPVSWLGLLLLHFTKAVPMNYWFMGITLAIAVIIFILDYVLPAKATKHFGGSKAGAVGTTIGLFIGIIAPIPLGILIGPFVGALIGELFFNKTDRKTAFKAAGGSFLGFLASTFMKFFVALIFTGLFVYKVVQNTDGFF